MQETRKRYVLALLGGVLVAIWGSCARGEQQTPQASTEPLRVARSTSRVEDRERALQYANRVTIYRDSHGVPHIEGETDADVVFGFAYAQAEDFFWQVEDTYILSLGRYSEVHGYRGLNSDYLNRAFEVVPRSQQDFATLEPDVRSLCEGFAAGLNFYLANHPHVKPRLIDHFEPWHVLAFRRQMTLELCYRYTRLSHSFMPRGNKRIWAAAGSNAWALGGQRTRSGNPMLLANPHLPWFGFGQLYEAHLRSGEGWNFTGATFFGSPILTIGHNEHLGWSMTVNEPDVADAWRVTFDNPNEPLNYRYDGGYRKATEWKETLKIKTPRGVKEKQVTFRKTHHGPLVEKLDKQTYLAAQIAGLYTTATLRQAIEMVRATNLDQFRDAVAMLQMTIMNMVYADRMGNIYFVYGGVVPKRDESFDWSKPVDGSDPRAEWQGIHQLDELPQILNPPSGYVQNCNSSPFTTTDREDLDRTAFPPYMIEDSDDDKRRARRSREILSGMMDVTFEDFQEAAFDTTVYWAKHRLPEYARHLETLKTTNAKLAGEVEPYLAHLLEWDCRVTGDSTPASLCEAWYEALYGSDYPGETMKEQFEGNPERQLAALAQTAKALCLMHGGWKVPYGEIHRVQRQPWVADLMELRFQDDQPSLPCAAAHGPMGVVFTQYYTPSIVIPLVISQKKRYGLVGTTYLAVYEFGADRVRGASLLQFGANGDPTSPHFFDQAQLLSEARLKPIPFTQAEVREASVRSYHPGK